MSLRWLTALLLLLLPGSGLAVAVTGALAVSRTAEGVAVTLALSAPLSSPPRAFALGTPLRWAIDLGGASSLRREAPGAGEAAAARVSQFDPATVRIVVDLKRPMQLASIVQDRNQRLELRFQPIDEAGFRRQVARGRAPFAGFIQERPRAVPPGPAPAADLTADSSARLDAVENALAEAERSLQGTGTPPAPPGAATPRGKEAAAARPPGRTRAVVVIDAGHGGKDPGAPTADGRHEKDATLAIARATRRAIEREARAAGVPIQVRLIRDDDRFVTLGGRVRLARQWGADLFISIHADSAPNIEARGASVYTLSDVASDREAARLAAKENRADLIAGVDLSGERADAASILVDLGLRDSMNASADFAQALQQAMEPRGVLFRSQFHRFAGFAVLRNLGVPAVLLETGYLSNARDADYLFSARGQNAIAEGIAEAVVRYVDAR